MRDEVLAPPDELVELGPTSVKASGYRCPYESSVIAMLVCPICACRSFGWAPAATISAAYVCRRSWKRSGSRPARRTAGRNVLCMKSLRRRTPPVVFGKTRPSSFGSRARSCERRIRSPPRRDTHADAPPGSSSVRGCPRRHWLRRAGCHRQSRARCHGAQQLTLTQPGQAAKRTRASERVDGLGGKELHVVPGEEATLCLFHPWRAQTEDRVVDDLPTLFRASENLLRDTQDELRPSRSWLCDRGHLLLELGRRDRLDGRIVQVLEVCE